MRSCLFALLLCAAAPQLFAQNTSPPLISVTGLAEIKVAPDEVVLRATILTRESDLQAVKKANDVIAQKAIAFLKEKGIKAEEIQTDHISIQPEYRRNDGPLKPEFYTANKSIEVIVKKVELLEPLLTGLLANGVNSIDGITFRHSNYKNLRIQARTMAVKFAKEKATALATDLDVKCGKVHQIEAIDDGGQSYYGYYNRGLSQVSNVAGGGGGGEGSEAEGFSVGQISITSRVKASFLIE